MIEYLVYMIRVKETGEGNNLRNFIKKNFSLKFFSLKEKQNLEKNFEENFGDLKGEKLDLDKVDDIIKEGRGRASLSVNLKAGYHFKFMRKLTTEVKVTQGIIDINK